MNQYASVLTGKCERARAEKVRSPYKGDRPSAHLRGKKIDLTDSKSKDILYRYKLASVSRHGLARPMTPTCSASGPQFTSSSTQRVSILAALSTASFGLG